MNEKILSAEIDVTYTLTVADESFHRGNVRVHMPAPVNSSMLHEGQILDFDPMFRMASVENYAQRSVWFDEEMEQNAPFTVRYAFTNEVVCKTPDISAINENSQVTFPDDQIERYEKTRDCDCGTYLGPMADRITLPDVADEAGLDVRGAKKQLEELFKGEDIMSLPYGDRIAKIYSFCRDAEDVSKLAPKEKDGTLMPWSRNLELVRLLRAAGIPARWQGGIDCRPAENVEAEAAKLRAAGAVEADLSESTDCGTVSEPTADREPSSDVRTEGKLKAEVTENESGSCTYEGAPVASDWAYICAAPYGWFVADAEAAHRFESAGYKREAAFFFGGIDPYRMPTAAKFRAGLYPAKDSERADIYVNVYGEAELTDRGLAQNEFTTVVRTETRSCQ